MQSIAGESQDGLPILLMYLENEVSGLPFAVLPS